MMCKWQRRAWVKSLGCKSYLSICELVICTRMLILCEKPLSSSFTADDFLEIYEIVWHSLQIYFYNICITWTRFHYHPFPRQTLIFFVFKICLFWKFHINWIIKYVLICVWLLSLSIIFLQIIHFVAWISTLF